MVDWNTVNWNTVAGFSTVFVQIIGFGVVFWGIQYQFEKQRKIEEENFKNNVNIGFYKELVARLSHTSPIAIASKFNSIVYSLDQSLEFEQKIGEYIPPKYSISDIDNSAKEITENIWEFISILDSYDIVSDNIEVFQKYLYQQFTEFIHLSSGLLQGLTVLLISENGIQDPKRLLKADDIDFDSFRERVEKLDDISYELTGYLQDIRVEIKNELLSEYYNRTSKIRKRYDGGVVLTSKDKKMMERIKAQIKMYENEHASFVRK